MLNAVLALKTAQYNASPKEPLNLLLVTAVSAVVIAIQSALLEPYKCISYLKIVQACSNLKWVSVIGRLKKEQACTNLKRARVIGLLKIEQACSNLKWARVIGHLKK